MIGFFGGVVHCYRPDSTSPNSPIPSPPHFEDRDNLFRPARKFYDRRGAMIVYEAIASSTKAMQNLLSPELRNL